MKASFAQLAVVAVALTGAYAQDTLMVNSPASAVVCQPLLITWAGGTPPYFLSIQPGNQPGAPAIQDFGRIDSGTSQSWVVTVPANTQLGITLRDSTGAISQSAPFPVNPGTDTSCLNATSSSSTTGSSTPTSSGGSSSSTGASTSAPVSTPRPTTTATTPATTGSTRPTTSGTTGGSTAPSTTPSSAAVSKFAQFGAAGVVGAAFAALLA